MNQRRGGAKRLRPTHSADRGMDNPSWRWPATLPCILFARGYRLVALSPRQIKLFPNVVSINGKLPQVSVVAQAMAGLQTRSLSVPIVDSGQTTTAEDELLPAAITKNMSDDENPSAASRNSPLCCIATGRGCHRWNCCLLLWTLKGNIFRRVQNLRLYTDHIMQRINTNIRWV